MELLSKKNLIIIITLFVVIGAIGYLWMSESGSGTKSETSTNSQLNANSENKASVDSQTMESDRIIVATDKTKYERGEDIKFVVTNNTENAIWYIIPASKCDKIFYGQMSRRGSGNEWVDGVIKWLNCGEQNAGVDSLQISKLESGKSLEQVWNQDVIYPSTEDNRENASTETEKMFPGIYKFVFAYAESEFSLKEISSLDAIEKNSFFSRQVFSEDFEIKDDGTLDLAVKKTRDAQRKSILSSFYADLVLYFDEHNDTYPISGANMEKLNDRNSTIYKALVPKYTIDSLMKDPKDPDSYFGYKSLDGKDFELTAVLENSEDKACLKMKNPCIYKFTSEGNVSEQ